MKGLREGAMKWKITCSYDQRGRNDDTMLQVWMSELDPLHSHNKPVCSKVQYVRINGDGCNRCRIGMSKVFYVFNMQF